MIASFCFCWLSHALTSFWLKIERINWPKSSGWTWLRLATESLINHRPNDVDYFLLSWIEKWVSFLFGQNAKKQIINCWNSFKQKIQQKKTWWTCSTSFYGFLKTQQFDRFWFFLKSLQVFFVCFLRMIFRCFLPFLGVCQSLLRPIDLSQFDWRKIKIVNVRKHRFSFSRWHFKTFFFRFTFVLQIFSWSWERMLTISKIFIGPVGSSNDQKCQINATISKMKLIEKSETNNSITVFDVAGWNCTNINSANIGCTFINKWGQ